MMFSCNLLFVHEIFSFFKGEMGITISDKGEKVRKF